MSTLYVLCICLSFGVCLNAINFFRDTVTLEDTESVVIESRSRTSRSVDLLYANSSGHSARAMRLSFMYGNEYVNINLTRNEHISTNPPIFTFNKEGIIERFPTFRNNKGRTLYQGMEVRASVLRDCRNTKKKCEVHGSFVYNGREMLIGPSKRGVHVVGKIPLTAIPTKTKYGALDIGTHIRHNGRIRRSTLKTATRPATSGKIPDINIVEVFIFTDQTEYNYYRKLEGSERKAIEALQLFMALQLNGVDLRFRSLGDINPNITTQMFFVGALIAKEKKDAPWIRKFDKWVVNNVETIYAFGEYQAQLSSDLIPPYDHAMAMTREYMSSSQYGGNEVLGVAFTKGMCLQNETYRVTLVSDTNYFVDFVIAHELGHNIGSRHDDRYSNDKCLPSQQYIMTNQVRSIEPENKENFWRFSPCSARGIKRYIAKTAGVCIRNHNFTPKQFNEDSDLPLAGVEISLDKQCQLAHGERANACETKDENVCWRGRKCRYGKGECYRQVLPYDGSPCGKNKWCCKGRCVAKPKSGSFNSCEV